MTMQSIKGLKHFSDILEQDGIQIVYWYTIWCPDCYMIKPHLPQLETDFPQATFYSVNRDMHLRLAKHYGIYGIPSFVVFKSGIEIGRLVNKNRKTYQEVYTFLEQVMG